MTSNEARQPYQDPTLPIEQRVEDLLLRMTLEDKAGQLFQTMASIGDPAEPGFMGTPSFNELRAKGLTHFNLLRVSDTREIAEWINAVQAEAAETALGIPLSISTDPRHSFSDNPLTALLSGPFSQWPEAIGFAAIGDVELARSFADTVRREYLAVGLRVALHPQIDLVSEPRWARSVNTFGSDVETTSALGVAYVEALRGEEFGAQSVSAMAKHFPGGGPQMDGEDPHFAYGREQVYPGGKFELHLEPFRHIIAAGVSQLMPYYGMPVGLERNGEKIEEVGFAFNKQILTGILREELGFTGIICSDWGVLNNTCWGVEDLTVEERMIKALDAGIDQFGGESDSAMVVRLVREGRISEERIDTSVRRLLTEKFKLGLFEHRFVDVDEAVRIVGDPASHEAGLVAQAAATAILTNERDGAPVLPLSRGIKVYAEGLDAESLAGRAELVERPEDADVAVVRLVAPWVPRGEGFELMFHRGSLEFPQEQIDHLRELSEQLPTIVDVFLDRPALLGEIAPYASALIGNFGVSGEALARVLFGEAPSRGRLPFDIPESMAAIEAAQEDVPNDTPAPAFRYGDGLTLGV